jgi:enolase
MGKIKRVTGREILDSRGNPTVEVEVELESGALGLAAVPSGASTGTFEALELRDGDEKRYGGQGVLKAVENVNTVIQENLVGKESTEQEKLDKLMLELDGTENKSKLGANAILGVSLAICRASAVEEKLQLFEYIAKIFKFKKKKDGYPVPMFNIINGGKHSDSGLSVQEFKLIPKGIKEYPEQLRAGSEIFHALKKILEKNGYSTGVGDEGGFAPRLESNSKALEIIASAAEQAGYKMGEEIFIGIDSAANSFYQEADDQYQLKPENVTLNKENLVNIYNEWIDKYKVISIEDGLAENDWEGWKNMNEKIGSRITLIGDDLLVTNVKMVEKAIDENACNAVLIKVNQIGSLTETIDCVKLTQKNKIKVVVSHRSGETTDDFIADLAVAINADFIKTGSLSRGERICKYNRLLRIWEIIK